MPPVTNRLDLALGPIAGDQARHLCPAQPRHLRHVPSQQAACLAALLRVLLLAQKLLDPLIHLRLGFALEPDPFAGLEKSLDLIEAQLLCFVHAGCQSSACHLLQAHLVLETDAFFRLILYWKRLPVSYATTFQYNRIDPTMTVTTSNDRLYRRASYLMWQERWVEAIKLLRIAPRQELIFLTNAQHRQNSCSVWCCANT